MLLPTYKLIIEDKIIVVNNKFQNTIKFFKIQ